MTRRDLDDLYDDGLALDLGDARGARPVDPATCPHARPFRIVCDVSTPDRPDEWQPDGEDWHCLDCGVDVPPGHPSRVAREAADAESDPFAGAAVGRRAPDEDAAAGAEPEQLGLL